MTPGSSSTPAVTAIPIVVPLGFAGSRHLLPLLPQGEHHSPAQIERFHASLQSQLVDVLRRLPGELGLSRAHVFCGVSQIAIGADTVFTRACAELKLPQRIFLPQSRDAYLSASGPEQRDDFAEAEIRAALHLLDSPHVIEESVVSDGSDRAMRFSDTNLEIIRECDLFVCLVRDEAEGQPGGTLELLNKAKRLGYPVLEIRAALHDSEAVCTQTRHNWPSHAPSTGSGIDRCSDSAGAGAPPWQAPLLPAQLMGTTRSGSAPMAAAEHILTDARGRLAALAAISNDEATLHRGKFRYAAAYIIGAHLSATVCAVVGLTVASDAATTAWLLLVELLLLASGVATHFALHHSGNVKRWAIYRLTAELCTSILAISNLRISMLNLYNMPFPSGLLPLLRTLHVLQLIACRTGNAAWPELRDAYFKERLDGQISYYSRERTRGLHRLAIANGVFRGASSVAFGITLVKLALPYLGVAQLVPVNTLIDTAVSVLAIALPMVAVAALSLAASFDLEARVHTYEETLGDLERARQRMQDADTEREFSQLALRAEHELLSETANWASRRSFTGVS